MCKLLALSAVLASCGPVVEHPEPEPEHEYTSLADEESARMEAQIEQEIYGSMCGPPATICNPDDPWSLVVCGTACFPDQGYCPEYTDWEITNCLQYCMAWTKDAGKYCDPYTCRPITAKKCVKGLTAIPPAE